jgi:hypothetical protein
MAAPATPSNVYVQQGNAQVYISFDMSPGATSYIIQRSLDNITYATVATPSVPSYLDVTVTAGVQYWYQVAAVSAGGTSAYSDAQSIVPTATGNMSLGQIRLLAQQEADRENSNFVSTPEWNNYINQSAFELYDLLTTVYEDYFLAPPLEFQTSGATPLYDLPNGTNYAGAPPFYKLMGVDMGLGGLSDAWVTIQKFDFISRNRYVYPNITSTFLGVFNLRYRIVGNQLMFIPTPAGQQVIRLWYIPRMTQLLKDTDVLDGVSGWVEYVIVDAAIKALEKEESDTTALMTRKAMLKQRIEESAMNRDAGQPDTISATRGYGNMSGSGWGPNGDGSFGGF